MQGAPIDKLATRLAENVATSNYKSAVRYARTMTTNTQNAGRYEGYRRAEKMGIDLTIEWCATLDNRTRHEHRQLHGQRRNVDEPFEVDGIKILYPAELNGKDYKVPEDMIWNCRCTLLAWVKGFEGETVKSSPKMGDMTFEEWQNDKAVNKMAVNGLHNDWSETVPRSFTKQEIENLKTYGKNAGVNIIDLSKFDGDPALLRSAIDTLEDLMHQYPIRNKLTLTVKILDNDDFADVKNRTIRLSHNALRDRRITEQNIQQIENKFASVHFEDIVAHEYGHIFVRENGINTLAIAKQTCYNVFGENYDDNKLASFLEQNISEYSTEGKTEIAAEIFAKHRASPSDFTKEFMRLLLEVVK